MEIMGPTGRTVNEAVFNYVRDAILNGYYAPGQRLIQEEIANVLNVSRIPVREAFHRLYAEGLVDLVPHKGATVASFSIEDLEDIYMMRTMLEIQAGKMATRNFSPGIEHEIKGILTQFDELLLQPGSVENNKKLSQANKDFHMAISKASGSKRLYHAISSIWNTFPRYGVIYDAQTSNKEHDDIFRAMKNKDEKAVGEMLKHHIETSGVRLIKNYKDYHNMSLSF